jgi:hypothetical protein
LLHSLETATTFYDMTTPQKRSDRWHRLDQLLGGLDAYVAERRGRGESWRAISMDIAIDTLSHPDVEAPTVATLTRWYDNLPAGTPQHAA